MRANAITALLLVVCHDGVSVGASRCFRPSRSRRRRTRRVWNGLTPLFCDVDPDTWLPSDAVSEDALLDRSYARR